MKYSKDIFKKDILTVLKYTLVIFLILTYWDLLLYFNLHNTISGVTIWNVLFMFPITLVLISLIGWHKKGGSIIYILLMLAVSIFYCGNFIYFKTFGSLVSISMLGVGGDAITNFWWSIATTIMENIVMVILFELPIILLIIEAIFIRRLNNRYAIIWHPFNLLLGVGLWFLVIALLPLGGTQDYTAYGAYHSRFVDTDTASKKLGILPNAIIESKYALFGSDSKQLIEVQEEEVIIEEPQIEYNKYTGLDFKTLSKRTSDSNISNICDYLSTILPTQKNDHTGLFEGYNLIYICGESFSSLAIDKNVTPTLYKMANNGIVLKNYYNGFKNTTTNGEYALMTGLWPDVAREETNMGKLTGTMGQSIDNDMSQCIGNKFMEIGAKTYGFHNYYGYYYGRNKTFPNMGLENIKFMNDGMSFSTSWPASDLELMQQSIPDYINDKQFLAYYMTFSGHGNYSEDNVMVAKNQATVLEKLGSRFSAQSANGYLACNYELELAMDYLLDELEKAGKLDNTVIVIAGDHYPYYLTDAGYECLTGKKISDDFEDYHSTCIIYNAAMAKEIVNEPCCNVDILPTILNLFNIKYDSRLYAGSDIFSNGKHVAMLYNKSFITSEAKYDATTGKTTWLTGQMKSPEEQEKYINSYNAYVKNKYAFSVALEQTDFYGFVFDNYTIPADSPSNVHIEERGSIEEIMIGEDELNEGLIEQEERLERSEIVVHPVEEQTEETVIQ